MNDCCTRRLGVRPRALACCALLVWALSSDTTSAQQPDCLAWDGPFIPPASAAGLYVDAVLGTPRLVDRQSVWDWESDRWIQLNPRNPYGLSSLISAVWDEARGIAWVNAYDSNEGRIVVIRFGPSGGEGGYSASGAQNDYPLGGAYAYDSRRGRVLRFGGVRSTGGSTGDLWSWDGAAWTRLSTTGPGSRSYAALAYDRDRDVAVTFGGTGGNPAFTWEWDGAAWSIRSIPIPPPRYSHAMVYDEARHVTVLFGGRDLTSMFADTWEYDGTEWTQRAVDGPSPRWDHAMTYDPIRGGVLLYGGRCSVSADPAYCYRDLWRWDGVAWTRLYQAPPPTYGDRIGLTWDTKRERAVLNQLGRLYEWDGRNWEDRGRSPHYGPLSYDASRRVVVAADDTQLREWDGESWTVRSAPGGPTTEIHSLAYDPIRRLTFVRAQGSEATWGWDGAAWALLNANGAGRAVHPSRMAFDANSGAVMLRPYGGATYEWDGASWALRGDSDQETRHVALVYDPVLGAMLRLVGRETRRWDGARWLSPEFPDRPDAATFSGGGAVFDPVHQFTIFYDGDNQWTTAYGDWSFERSPQPLVVLEGDSATFVARIRPTATPSLFWARDDRTLPQFTARLIGVNYRILTIRPVVPEDGGQYRLHAYGNNCQTLLSDPALLVVIRRGDADCDGAVDNRDIDAFVTALLSPAEYADLYPDCLIRAADVNRDGAIDAADIDWFVECLVEGACRSP